MKILLVDDEKDFVAALAERLVLRGIDVDYVTNGIDAVRLATDNNYDVVVADVKMPKFSGLDVLKSVREVKKEVKFIFMTGHAGEESFHACKEAGAVDYLMKPIKIDVLIEKVLEAART